MPSLGEVAQVLEARRKALGLTQKDMLMRIGMSQQQYQRIESGGDTRLSTLLRVLEGMGLELRLVPRDKRAAVDALMHDRAEVVPKDGVVEPREGQSWDAELGDLGD